MRQNDDNLLFFQHRIEQREREREEKETINDGNNDDAQKIDHFLSLSLSRRRFATLYRRFEESTLTFLLEQRRRLRRQLETYSKQFTSPFLSVCGTHGNASFRLSLSLSLDHTHAEREIRNTKKREKSLFSEMD